MTTIEIDRELSSLNSECPDDLARTLNIMRRKGLIKGEVSMETGSWIWWIDGEGVEN